MNSPRHCFPSSEAIKLVAKVYTSTHQLVTASSQDDSFSIQESWNRFTKHCKALEIREVQTRFYEKCKRMYI